MSLKRLVAIAAAGLLPAIAVAQGAPPQLVAARAVTLQQRCQAAGGQVINGDRPFVHNMDLNGDGRAEWILDDAGFACSNRSVSSVTPTGAPLEVVDGATGQSLWRGMAYTYTLQPGQARNTLVVTLRGPVCSPNALATTTCQRPLIWNAQSRQLAGAPSIAATTPPTSRDPLATGPQPKVGAEAPKAAASPPVQHGSGNMTLTEADKAAAFRALGFKRVGRAWKLCNEELPTLSYAPGAIEEVLDLNGDGRPEVVITESSLSCYGAQGSWFGVASKEAKGSWRKVMEISGIFHALPSRANGWQEIEVGGPGLRGSPIWRYNGREYVFNRAPGPSRP